MNTNIKNWFESDLDICAQFKLSKNLIGLVVFESRVVFSPPRFLGNESLRLGNRGIFLHNPKKNIYNFYVNLLNFDLKKLVMLRIFHHKCTRKFESSWWSTVCEAWWVETYFLSQKLFFIRHVEKCMYRFAKG